MRKEVIFLLSCLFFNFTIAMETVLTQEEYFINEGSPLSSSKERTAIKSYVNLSSYVANSLFISNDFTRLYDVKPKALVGYFDEQDKEQLLSCYSKENIEALYKTNSEKYELLVKDVVHTMFQEKNSSEIVSARKKLQQNIKDQTDMLQIQINFLIPRYQKEKKACMHYFCRNTALGVAVVSGISTIAVFSWMINHCYNLFS